MVRCWVLGHTAATRSPSRLDPAGPVQSAPYRLLRAGWLAGSEPDPSTTAGYVRSYETGLRSRDPPPSGSLQPRLRPRRTIRRLEVVGRAAAAASPPRTGAGQRATSY